MVKAIKELKEAPEAKGDMHYFYNNEYYEPLLEYVYILSEHLTPHTEIEHHAGLFLPTSYSEFITRYFADKVGKRDSNNFLMERKMLETIELMGYDVEMFWYLILFISDFSYSYCKKGVDISSPRRKIIQFVSAIENNVDSNEQHFLPEFKEEMNLTLSIGKKKLVIDDQDAIHHLSLFCRNELNKAKRDDNLDGVGLAEIEKQKANIKELKNPIQIFYFTKIFQTFFKLKPPARKRGSVDHGEDFSQNFLISQICFFIGLTKNRRYMDEVIPLNKLLSYYKGQKNNKLNGIYATQKDFLNLL